VKHATDSQKDMTASADALTGEIREQWAADAAAKAKEKMGEWHVSDGDAAEAMNALNSLPKEAQAGALKKLDNKTFDTLLDQVDEDRHEQGFKTLVDNCDDPERKLKLFGAQHKSHQRNEAERLNDKEDTGGLDFWNDTKQQDAAESRQEKRETIAKTTSKEIDEEIKHLQDEAAKSGKPIDMKAVNDVMARKQLESQIEMKHAVNLTNDKQGDETRDRAAWTKGELEEVQKTLDKLPAEHVAGNKHLHTINRMAQREEDKSKKIEGDPVADHLKGHINFYGLKKGDQANVEHHRMKGIGSIQGTLTHEIGHNLHGGDYAKEWQELQDQAGWEKHEKSAVKGAMKTAGATDDEAKAAMKKMEDPDTNEPVTIGNRVFIKNQYGKWVSRDKGALPEELKNKSADQAHAGDWRYCCNNQADHFAEMYTKMVHMPDETKKALIDLPEQKVTAASTLVATEQASVDALKAAGQGPGDPDFDQATEDLEAQKKELAEAKDNAARQAEQHKIMKDKVMAK